MQQVAIFIYQITVLLYGLGIRIVAIFSPKLLKQKMPQSFGFIALL